jgi:hypothetical protein
VLPIIRPIPSGGAINDRREPGRQKSVDLDGLVPGLVLNVVDLVLYGLSFRGRSLQRCMLSEAPDIRSVCAPQSVLAKRGRMVRTAILALILPAMETCPGRGLSLIDGSDYGSGLQ